MRSSTICIALLLIFFLASAQGRLRNKDETTSCENEEDFECQPGECIDAALKCNSVYDCVSLADEAVELCGCPPGEFQCFNSCIPLKQRCDGSCDCGEDCADERNCDSFQCLPEYIKCNNHRCVPHFTLCDFIDDCGDMSDEANCTRTPCYTTQFTCQNKECINFFFICDGIPDCVDGSDELPDLCKEGSFVDCGDGSRVHRLRFCDGFAHCPGNEADESDCECEADVEYQCSNSKCIWKAKVCDRRCDCLDCGDEVDCYNQEVCDTDTHIMCPIIGDATIPPRCLRQEYICDGHNDCAFPMDEQCTGRPGRDGVEIDCDADPFMLRCSDAEDQRCLPASYVQCTQAYECLRGTDEQANCSVVVCGADEFQCARGGRCISEAYRCDVHVDCADGSDEENCESFVCPEGKRKCAAGHCIDDWRFCDYHHDCFYHNGRPDLSDEADCEAVHSIPCREDEFRCLSGQCIAGWRRCFADSRDGTEGCADGSHLRNCSAFQCPGQFKCSRSHCVDVSLICDGSVDCVESWADETKTDGQCAVPCSNPGCTCFHRSQECTNTGLNHDSLDITSKEYASITQFKLAGNNFSHLIQYDNALKGMERVVYLDLSNNSISFINNQALRNMPILNTLILADNQITTLESNTFSGMSRIKTLVLKGNHIHTIQEKAFVGLSELTTLDLSGLNISTISKGAFEGLQKLALLNLSSNILKRIPQGAFFGLGKLTVLDVFNNTLVTIDRRAFFGLPKLRELKTDEYRFCCAVRDMPSLESCLPEADEFSSCEDLMANVFLRGSIWVIGIIASVGNLVVILMRMNNKRDHRVHSFLITNLAIGDFLMGVYLLIIASVDAWYRGFYIVYDAEWRHSGLCRFAGFLSTFSSELSVFSLTIITLHRLFSILFPFRIKDMEFSGAVRVMVVAWLMVIFLAAFPLSGVEYFGNFYGRSGVCLALHITPERPAGWEYSVFIFLVLNFISIIVIALSYSVMFVVARRTQKAVKRSRDGNSGDAMARRMTLIVMTDFVCWVPIILLGVASLGGAYVPPQVFAWIAVFVLPVNSAVNPMLYTLLTAPYVRRVMSRARTSLNMSLATMTTDMKQANYAGERQSRGVNGRQGYQAGSRTGQRSDANRNAIKLTALASQSDTEPDEALGRSDESTALRAHTDATDTEDEGRDIDLCHALPDSYEDGRHRNV